MELKRQGKLRDKGIIANFHQIEMVSKILPVIYEDMENVKELEQPLPSPPRTPPKIVEIDNNFDLEEVDEKALAQMN